MEVSSWLLAWPCLPASLTPRRSLPPMGFEGRGGKKAGTSWREEGGGRKREGKGRGEKSVTREGGKKVGCEGGREGSIGMWYIGNEVIKEGRKERQD